ncbi:hypothetical protein ACFE04_003851 [Oxalis oulophora]
MDSIISSALEEICLNQGGLTLSSLWLKLKIDLSTLKQSIWTNLRNIPTIELRVKNKVYAPTHSSITLFEDAERLDLRIVANQALSDNFLGLYDIPLADAKVSNEQRRTLERIAVTRTNGITQNQLSGELGADKKRLWYDVKRLESSGLIVRQKADEKRKQDGEIISSLNVHTSLVHLHRYAKHLGSHQKFQITKEEQMVDDDSESTVKDNVSVNDFQPEIKAVCQKLEQAHDKVLVVADIRREVGFFGGGGPSKRRWRSICERMKNDRIVEFFNAEVNGKLEYCLRLVKKFSPKTFHLNSVEGGGEEQIIKFGRQQNNSQLVELSIEHQIYDAIDRKKSEGLTSVEVGKMLGIDSKRNYKRVYGIVKRFGMHLRREMHKRTEVYRVWTPNNFNPESSNLFASVSKKLVSESLNQDILGTSIEEDCASPRKENGKFESTQSRSGSELNLGSKPSAKSTDPSPTKKSIPCPEDQSKLLTTDNIQRDQRILQRLQEEKFVLKIELYRWLVNLEKEDKGTQMDRRTLKRSIHRLEQNGQCKYVVINVPVVKNSKSTFAVDVVLHPSVQNISPELVVAVEDKYKSFRGKYQKRTLCELNDDESVPVLDGIKRGRVKEHEEANSLATRLVSMRANGFVVGKMIRAKFFHSFLWNHLKLGNVQEKSFDIEAAIKNIPLELFLQVIGSAKTIHNLLEKCQKGLRLCDLPVQELKNLKDTRATGRLSVIISMLEQLKLIRLVTSGHSTNGAKIPRVSPVYALELNVYIEEPQSMRGNDIYPKVQHDFVLSSIEAVDEYWQTLEYCYATADEKAASKAFPGSVVPQVFYHRAWGSVQTMTAGVYSDLLFHLPRSMDDPILKLPFEICKKFAKEHNVTLAQVLLAYVYKNRKRNKQLQANLDNDGEACQSKNGSSRKRMRSSEARSVKCRRVDDETEELSNKILLESTNTSNILMEENDASSISPTKHRRLSQDCEVTDRQTAEEVGLNETHEPSRKGKRTRYIWTPEADRKMITQYVRYRVALGAKFHRVLWDAIKDLPASPDTCRRRMSSLNQYKEFRIALLRFCNLLSKRYEKQLGKRQRSVQVDDHRLARDFFDEIENSPYKNVEKDRWDDFTEKEIKDAFQSVLQCKEIAILEAYRRAVCVSESQFPKNTEKDAARFSNWLHEKQGDLKKAGAILLEDLHCGDIFHLFGQLSLGKLSISTRLPNEGVGEAEGTIENDEYYDGRKAKGFPGIRLSVHYVPQLRVNLVEQSQTGNTCANEIIHGPGSSNTLCQQSCDISSPAAGNVQSVCIQEDCLQSNVLQKGTNDASREFKSCAVDNIIENTFYKKLRHRVFGTIMQNPGMLEDDIVSLMTTVKPESCRMLLNVMVEDNFLTVRKIHQTASSAVPTMLTKLVRNNSEQQKTICRKHLFANTMKVSSL